MWNTTDAEDGDAVALTDEEFKKELFEAIRDDVQLLYELG